MKQDTKIPESLIDDTPCGKSRFKTIEAWYHHVRCCKTPQCDAYRRENGLKWIWSGPRVLWNVSWSTVHNRFWYALEYNGIALESGYAPQSENTTVLPNYMSGLWLDDRHCPLVFVRKRRAHYEERIMRGEKMVEG